MPNKVKLTMSDTQWKSTRHAKKQESATTYNEKNKSTETHPEPAQVLELVDKDMKTVIITVFHTLKS